MRTFKQPWPASCLLSHLSFHDGEAPGEALVLPGTPVPAGAGARGRNEPDPRGWRGSEKCRGPWSSRRLSARETDRVTLGFSFLEVRSQKQLLPRIQLSSHPDFPPAGFSTAS